MDDTIIRKFMERFNFSEVKYSATEDEIKEIENRLKISYPEDYKSFLKIYGNAYTPDILDIVVDKGLDLHDLNTLASVSEIMKEQEAMWEGGLGENLIFFGNDSMGNLFCFDKRLNMKVIFWDHDFDTVEAISDTFTGLIEKYIKI